MKGSLVSIRHWLRRNNVLIDDFKFSDKPPTPSSTVLSCHDDEKIEGLFEDDETEDEAADPVEQDKQPEPGQSPSTLLQIDLVEQTLCFFLEPADTPIGQGRSSSDNLLLRSLLPLTSLSASSLASWSNCWKYRESVRVFVSRRPCRGWPTSSRRVIHPTEPACGRHWGQCRRAGPAADQRVVSLGQPGTGARQTACFCCLLITLGSNRRGIKTRGYGALSLQASWPA